MIVSPVPDRSYTTPSRGETLNALPFWTVSLMPWPAWKAPLKRFEPGVSRPMNRASTVLASVGATPCAMSAGSMPRRSAPEHGDAVRHTGLNSPAADAWLNSSGRKFDTWCVVSHCGVRM